MNNIHDVWKKVDIKGPDDCWPWTGYTSSGRGRMDLLGKKGIYAHRIAYISARPFAGVSLDRNGDVNICHTCDNPLCCNPEHLFIGTHLDNMRDKKQKGRCPDLEGPKGPRSKLTEEDVRDIRILKKRGATKKALAMLYEVSEATISGACYGRHYANIS